MKQLNDSFEQIVILLLSPNSLHFVLVVLVTYACTMAMYLRTDRVYQVRTPYLCVFVY